MHKRTQQREQQLAAVLHYIESYIAQHGRSPSYDEIADGCFMARSTAVRYLDMLEGRGHIERIPYTPRSISIVKRMTPSDDP